jgi:sugar (pentulose or hexulose) kinase
MSNDYLLAIDNGTQSVRALIFDLHGHLVDKAQVDITSYRSPQPGWVENDPEEFWVALCQACQRLWANTQIPKSSIRGVVITTQRATTINLDDHGQPLRPAIIWLDQRRADTRPNLPGGGNWRYAPSACATPSATSRARRKPTGSPSTSPRSGRAPPSICCSRAT